MKKKNLFLTMAATVAATAVLMTSCGNNEDENNTDRVKVLFSSGIDAVQTRATDKTWAANDEIGIYMIKNGENLAVSNLLEGTDNRQYKATTSGTTVPFAPVTAGTEIYYPVADNVQFIAYYPYFASPTNYKLPINLSSQTSQPALDVLYAPAGAVYNKTSGTVSLPFAHKLVKLVFNISNSADITTPLAGLTVSIDKQKISGNLDLATGTITATGDATSTISAKVAANGATAEAIVFAGAQTGKFSFTNSTGETFSAAIPTAFEGGNKYTYTVTLTKKAVTVTGTISDWNAIDGGNIPVN